MTDERNAYDAVYAGKPLSELLEILQGKTNANLAQSGPGEHNILNAQDMAALNRAIDAASKQDGIDPSSTVDRVLAGKETSFGIGPRDAVKLQDEAIDRWNAQRLSGAPAWDEATWTGSLGERTGASRGKGTGEG